MSGSPVTNLAFIRAKAGKEAELEIELKKLLPTSRAEEACIAYDLHRSADDPRVWFFYEVWRSKEDLAAHLQTAPLQALLAKAPELVEGDMDLRSFIPVDIRAGK